MALTRSVEAAYLEARYRHANGRRSPQFRGDEMKVRVWMAAFEIGTEKNVAPWDALLLVTTRRAMRVEWLDREIAERLAYDRRATTDPETGAPVTPPPGLSDEVQALLAQSRAEDKVMMTAAKWAIDAGVATEMVRRMRLEGKVAVSAIVAALDAIGATPDQRIAAMEAAHAALQNDDGPPRLDGHGP